MHVLRTRRLRVILAVVAMALVATACGPDPAQGPPVSACGADGTSAAIYNRVNAERAANGLAALAWDGQLSCLATDWSAQMAASGNLHHRDLAGVIRSPGYGGYGTLGENVLRGAAGMSPDQMVDAWMASATHRTNVLSGSFSSLGIGLAVSPDGSQVYATQNFGG